MIVGTKEINLKVLKSKCGSIESLITYCEELVPRIVRHNREIVDNQKYLVALYLRDIKTIPFDKRHELCEELLRDVSLTGHANEIHDFDEILGEIDVDKLATYINKRRKSDEF